VTVMYSIVDVLYLSADETHAIEANGQCDQDRARYPPAEIPPPRTSLTELDLSYPITCNSL